MKTIWIVLSGVGIATVAFLAYRILMGCLHSKFPIPLPKLGATPEDVRRLYGHETEIEPDEDFSSASCYVFLVNDYRVFASFHKGQMGRIFIHPPDTSSFYVGEIDAMKDYYGESKEWKTILDGEDGWQYRYHRSDEEVVFLLADGVPQAKTRQWEEASGKNWESEHSQDDDVIIE